MKRPSHTPRPISLYVQDEAAPRWTGLSCNEALNYITQHPEEVFQVYETRHGVPGRCLNREGVDIATAVENVRLWTQYLIRRETRRGWTRYSDLQLIEMAAHHVLRGRALGHSAKQHEKTAAEYELRRGYQRVQSRLAQERASNEELRVLLSRQCRQIDALTNARNAALYALVSVARDATIQFAQLRQQDVWVVINQDTMSVNQFLDPAKALEHFLTYRHGHKLGVYTAGRSDARWMSWPIGELGVQQAITELYTAAYPNGNTSVTPEQQ